MDIFSANYTSNWAFMRCFFSTAGKGGSIFEVKSQTNTSSTGSKVSALCLEALPGAGPAEV